MLTGIWRWAMLLYVMYSMLSYNMGTLLGMLLKTLSRQSLNPSRTGLGIPSHFRRRSGGGGRGGRGVGGGAPLTPLAPDKHQVVDHIYMGVSEN